MTWVKMVTPVDSSIGLLPAIQRMQRFPDGSGPAADAVDVLGTPVDGWVRRELLDCVVRWAAQPEGPKRTVLYANVHVLNTAYHHPLLLQELRSASTVYCDGSGVRLGAALLGRTLPPRMTGADWIDPLCRLASGRQLSLFLLGGAPGIAESAARVLQARYPSLRIAGTHHGYADETDASVVEVVNRSAARILLIGMGTPRQELWIRRYRSQLEPPVAWAVGALFDFLAGAERRGPQWMLDHHLEWVARLIAKPGTHWRRYLLGNPLFVARVLRQRVLGLPARLTAADAENASG